VLLNVLDVVFQAIAYLVVIAFLHSIFVAIDLNQVGVYLFDNQLILDVLDVYVPIVSVVVTSNVQNQLTVSIQWIQIAVPIDPQTLVIYHSTLVLILFCLVFVQIINCPIQFLWFLLLLNL